MDEQKIDFLNPEASKIIPEYFFVNLDQQFAPVVFTVPNLSVNLPANYALSPSGNLSVKIKNNGRFCLYPLISNKDFHGDDLDKTTTIESVTWNDFKINGKEIIRQRSELLEDFFSTFFKDKKEIIRKANSQMGLSRNSFLYRAITGGELRDLSQNGSCFYSHLDPSTNFETENMYNSQYSQVKTFSQKTSEGYSGLIVRWKIEDPLLYRISGIAVPRVIPFFSHFLPENIEICQPGQNKFEKLKQKRELTVVG